MSFGRRNGMTGDNLRGPEDERVTGGATELEFLLDMMRVLELVVGPVVWSNTAQQWVVAMPVVTPPTNPPPAAPPAAPPADPTEEEDTSDPPQETSDPHADTSGEK